MPDRMMTYQMAVLLLSSVNVPGAKMITFLMKRVIVFRKMEPKRYKRQKKQNQSQILRILVEVQVIVEQVKLLEVQVNSKNSLINTDLKIYPIYLVVVY